MFFEEKIAAGLNLKNYLRNHCIDPEIHEHLKRIPKTLGSFGHDPWGYSQDGLAFGLSLFKFWYEEYFRTVAVGLENIPAKGRVLIIANHSGQVPLDGMMIGYAITMNKENPRAARAMIERWVPTVPFIGNLLNSFGAVVGDPVNCTKMLHREEAIIVFPEGVRGSGKTIDKKYQLQRFGTGFMHLAVKEKTPIIPVGVVGCEETFPSIANIKPLAKAFGMPYFPLMPLLPLPAKVRLHFGEPKLYDVDNPTEDSIQSCVNDVKQNIQALIQQGLNERKSWFN